MTQQNLTSSTDLPPQFALFQLATGHYISQAIHVAAELGIADLLAEGAQRGDVLAKATGTHKASLTRVLRLLASVGVLNETENGAFTLSPIGECLRTDRPGAFRSVARLFARRASH